MVDFAIRIDQRPPSYDGERARAFALPTAEREAQKQRLSAQLEADSLADLRKTAHRLYDALWRINAEA